MERSSINVEIINNGYYYIDMVQSIFLQRSPRSECGQENVAIACKQSPDQNKTQIFHKVKFYKLTNILLFKYIHIN